VKDAVFSGSYAFSCRIVKKYYVNYFQLVTLYSE
jgi:hypothetical protein